MKHYEINMNVSLTVKNSDYSFEMTPIVKFSVTEKLPANVDPEKYIRQRLGEEVKRQFGQLVEVIDNKTEDAETDPLDQ